MKKSSSTTKKMSKGGDTLSTKKTVTKTVKVNKFKPLTPVQKDKAKEDSLRKAGPVLTKQKIKYIR